MYLVSADLLQRPLSWKSSVIPEDKEHVKSPYEKWLKMRQKMSEADIRQKTEENAIADFF